MTGNWFVIYPEEKLVNTEQSKIYTKIQDSLVTDKGVKLISCLDNGQFIQWDSTILRGKWGIIDENRVVVSGAGKGFQNFKAEFAPGENDKIKLTEFLNISGERIKITWHLKKIKGGKEAELFDPEKNNWRTKPTTAETEDAMKKRMSAMLYYYSVYFKLISDNSSYFMPVRVMAPLKFYQHAIGMKDFDSKHRFVSLFYSVEDATKAYELLKEVVNNSDYNFPDSDSNSFSLEYSYMLAHLAEEILK
jgi:hypothetical protein